MATAIVSAFTSRPVRRDVAMTGEITLRGNVLPIGGLKEKVLAAHRAKIATIIIPEGNRRHLVEIPKALRKDLEFVLAGHVSEVLEAALLPEEGPAQISQEPVPPTTKGRGAARRPITTTN